MVLVRPVTHTVISSSQFGQPVSDFIVANTPTAWATVVLLNGWTNAADKQPFQYRRIGTVGYTRGTIRDGAMGSPAFQLPVGFRAPLPLDLITACQTLTVAPDPPPVPPAPPFVAELVWVAGVATLDAGGVYVPTMGANKAWSVNHAFSLVS